MEVLIVSKKLITTSQNKLDTWTGHSLFCLAYRASFRAFVTGSSFRESAQERRSRRIQDLFYVHRY